MPTAYYVGNAQTIAQVDSLVVTAVAVGGTVGLIINGKTIAYTCITGDTTITAATALLALLKASTVPPEFTDYTYTASSATITCTAATPGTPVTATLTTSGGTTATFTNTTANSSPADPGIAANWSRSGIAALPQNGDDVVVQSAATPILYNLAALVAVKFATYTRWGSATGQIGLPDINPKGYLEYRPTHFEFIGPLAGNLPMILGEGPGSGPTLERYNVSTQQATLTINSGGTINFLGSNASNVANVIGATFSVAMGVGEVAVFTNVTGDGGSTIILGTGVTVSGTLSLINSNGTVYCAPGTVKTSASTLVNGSTGLTFGTVTGAAGSTITWLSNSTITTLTLTGGTQFDKSGDLRAVTITNSTIDGDCTVNDPNSSITWTNATTVNGQVTSGPFVFLGPRTVKVT